MGISKSVVYFGYLGEEGTDEQLVRKRLAYMDQQLRWLFELVEASGDSIEVLVAYVSPRTADAEVHRAIERHGFRIDPESVGSDRRNSFEYPGLRAMKTLAEARASTDLIFYCHSKGILQLAASKMGQFRLHTAVGLTARLDAMTLNPRITRAGLFPARWGWCWYNFFWVKAGYMAGLTVEESTDRYDFEALIGDRSDKEGYQGVLGLIDQLPYEDRGIAVQPWYRAEETSSPALNAAHYRYAGMTSARDAVRALRS